MQAAHEHLCSYHVSSCVVCRQLKGKVKVGAVNCDEEKGLCGKFSVQGFPTIKFFGKSKSRPEDYQGPREAAALVAFGTEKWSRFAPPPEVRFVCPVRPLPLSRLALSNGEVREVVRQKL